MKLLLYLACGLAPLFSFGTACSAHEGANSAFTSSSAELSPVHVDEDGQRAIGLKLRPAERALVEHSIKTTGEVIAAENQSFQVTPRVSGIVKSVQAQYGDFVKRDQVLVVVHSIDVANAITDLLNTKAQLTTEISRVKVEYKAEMALEKKELDLSRQHYDRLTTLLKERIAAEKDYLTAKSAYEKSQVRLETLKQKLNEEIALREEQLRVAVANGRGQLEIMGLSDKAIDEALSTGSVNADLPIRAPVSGTITARSVTVGERLEPNKQIFSIVNLSPIWVMVDVFQENLGKVRTGQKVKIQTPAKQLLTGEIENVASVIDPMKKTLHVRIVASNPQGILKPGMFVNADILLGGGSYGHIALPNSAIVKHQDRSIIFIKQDDHFAPKTVHLGSQSGTVTEILDDIEPGVPVVVQGATQLKAQALLHGGEEHHEHEAGEAESEEHGHHHHEAKKKEHPPDPHAHGHGKKETSPEARMLLVYFAGVLTMLIIVVVWLAVKRMRDSRRSANESQSTGETSKVIERVE